MCFTNNMLKIKRCPPPTEMSTGPDVTSLAFECLTEDTASVLPLVADLLTRPAMPQSRIDLARVQLLDAIEHQNDAPGGIPRRELAKLIYGQASVHARTPSADQVAKMSRGELVQFLKTWQRPDSSILGITGAQPLLCLNACIVTSCGSNHVVCMSALALMHC